MSNGDSVGKIKDTLTELTLKNFIELKKKRSKSRKKHSAERVHKTISRQKSSISSVIASILTSSIVNSKKDDEKEKDNLEKAADEEPEDKEEKLVHGGYGTIKPYVGMSPNVKYTDYSKIWSHLGAFRTYKMFEHLDDASNVALTNGESSREMISERTMDMGARNFKFFGNMNINNTAQDYYTVTSLVPPVGANIDSKDWEKYVLMMKMSIYQPLIALKFKFA